MSYLDYWIMEWKKADFFSKAKLVKALFKTTRSSYFKILRICLGGQKNAPYEATTRNRMG